MKYKSLKEIGAYYNEAHFLRPLKAHLVDDYADLMKDGVEFPPITLGEYPNGKVIVDGVHTFRAAGMAMINRVAVTVIQYKSLADALADQLKRNVNHGMRLLPGERDARIRMLHEIYKWNGVKIGEVVGLSRASVSRILRGQQNITGTGKPGPHPLAEGEVREEVDLGPFAPRAFVKVVNRIHVTIAKASQRTALMEGIRNPAERVQLLAVLHKVYDEVKLLLDMAQKVKEAA